MKLDDLCERARGPRNFRARVQRARDLLIRRGGIIIIFGSLILNRLVLFSFA